MPLARMLRTVMDRGGTHNAPVIRSVVYMYQNGEDLHIIQGTAQKDAFIQMGQVFQDALKQTILASQP